MSLHQTVFLVQLFQKSLVKNNFYNKEYLSKYNNTSKSKRHVIPGQPILIGLNPFLSHITKGGNSILNF